MHLKSPSLNYYNLQLLSLPIPVESYSVNFLHFPELQENSRLFPIQIPVHLLPKNYHELLLLLHYLILGKVQIYPELFMSI